jgi:hypothetical protein
MLTWVAAGWGAAATRGLVPTDVVDACVLRWCLGRALLDGGLVSRHQRTVPRAVTVIQILVGLAATAADCDGAATSCGSTAAVEIEISSGSSFLRIRWLTSAMRCKLWMGP